MVPYTGQNSNICRTSSATEECIDKGTAETLLNSLNSESYEDLFNTLAQWNTILEADYPNITKIAEEPDDPHTSEPAI